MSVSDRTRYLALAVIAASCTLEGPGAQAQLEEVIVTAQKRSESAQEVPIAITAFDAEAMKAQQITGFADMRFAAPNVSYTKANFAGNNFMIRGVGTNLVAASADSGVGVHVNEVPLISPRLFETEYYDVEQVAVLRGPQGTLYGRNSTGGAVNMITRKATPDQLEGNIEGQLGNFEHRQLSGAINIPLGNQFGMRFAGIWLDREGYTENLYTGNDVDGRDQYSLRGAFNWSGQSTSADLMVSYFDEDSSRVRSQKTLCLNDPSGLLGCLPDGLDFDLANPSSQLSNIAASDLKLGPLGIFEFGSNRRSLNPRDLRKVNSEFDPTYEADETLVTFELKQELDLHTLALVAGYQDTEVISRADYQWSLGRKIDIPDLVPALVPQNYQALFYDGLLPLSAPSKNSTGSIGGHVASRNDSLESFDQSNQSSEQYSIELRLQSDYAGRFNFLLGGFYMDLDMHNEYWVLSNGFDYVAGVVAAATRQDGLGWVGPQLNVETREYAIESSALFGEIYVDFTDTLKLTVGARYTIDEKNIRHRQVLLNSDPETDERLLQPLNADLPIAYPYGVDDEEWKEITGRMVIDWALSNETLAYASYSRGYKPGGFNPPFDPIEFPGLDSTFDPEFVNAVEIGIKNTLLDNTLKANFTAFYYEYEDMQISRILNRSSFNGNTDAQIYGFEGEFIWAPDQHWVLNSNIAYLHSEAKDYEEVDPRDPTQGRDDVTLIKDINNATNCVALVDPGRFASIAGSQFNSCVELTEAGLPIVDGIDADMDGNHLQNSPQWSINLGAQYRFNLPADYDLALRVDYYWQDDMYARIFNRPVDKIDDWDIWNAQAYLSSPENRWYVRAFVKNIADDDNLVGMFLSGASSGLFTNVFTIEPRTYGLALGYNFN